SGGHPSTSSTSPTSSSSANASSTSGTGGATGTGGAPGTGGAAGTGGSVGDAGPDAPPPGPTRTAAHQGTSGGVRQGTLLTAAAAPFAGEVFVDGTGKIACAAASCASTTGYGSATVIACPGSVISAGLINAHDHTDYGTVPPVTHGTTRWLHR